MRSLIACLFAAGAGAAVATSSAAVPVETLPASLTLSLDRVHLSGAEAMGLVGTSYTLELAPDWWVGPALYGAATGRRGGLFTWGAEASYRWHLAPRWQFTAGLYAGGGGGAGAPVGGGLMLRPHADLSFDLGGWSLGVAASRLGFPSGSIRSTQLGLVASFSDRFAFVPSGHGSQLAAFDGPAGLGIEHISVVFGRYAAVAGQGGSFDTVGVQAEWPLRGPLSATAAAAGAAKGAADGYAEFTAGLLALWPAEGAALRWGVQGSLGMGGGGAVATGGGSVTKVAVVGRLRSAADWSVELQAGHARAFTGDFRTGYAQLSVGFDFGRAPLPDQRVLVQNVHDTEWSLGIEHYLKAQRKTGGDPGLSAVSLDVRRSLGDHLYLSGSAVSAISGGAGAFSAGLLGLGVSTQLGEAAAWSAGFEATVGAAGGGGVASQGGAIVRPMAWAGHTLGRYGKFKVAAGYVKSVRGDLASPVVDLSWAMAFGTP